MTSGDLSIAMVGTRGVPAHYGGFETAVEEVGSRLAAAGHEVTVYCRSSGRTDRLDAYRGMRLVQLPAARRKSLETPTHTGLSVAHLISRGRPDVALVFNAANSPMLPALRARSVPVATHVDGLEWQRSKWGRAGRRYYRLAEGLAVRWSDAIIADAQGIADYYRAEFGVEAVQISYGAPILRDLGSQRLQSLGVKPGKYHLVVARFEPENHVDTAVDGYVRSRADLPLIVVGSAPYADEYTARVNALAERDPRVRMLGAIWDQQLLDELYANARTYIHGHSVGGTNPSLLRAMGAGAPVLAFDVIFNREVLGFEDGYWSSSAELAPLIEESEGGASLLVGRGVALQARAASRYRWDDVADSYERLCRELASNVRRSGTVPSLRYVLGR